VIRTIKCPIPVWLSSNPASFLNDKRTPQDLNIYCVGT